MRKTMKKFWLLSVTAFVLVAFSFHPALAWNPDEVKRPQDVLKTTDLKKLSKSLKSYLDEDDLLKKEKLLERLRSDIARTEKSKKLDPLLKFPDFFGELINGTLDFKRSGYLKGKLNTVSNEATVRGKTYKNQYELWLPRNYDARTSWPLVLCLHPDGETGKSYFEKTYANSSLAESCAFLCPTLQSGHESWTSNEGKVQILLLSLKEVWETYNFDRTRLFLDGTGDGAQQVLTLASWYADLFAGVVVRSTNPPEKLFYHNFRHLPVALLAGENDGNNVTVMRAMEEEFKKAGQDASKLFTVAGSKGGFLGDGSDLITDWVLAQRLVEYPTEITWSSGDRAYGRAYWLQVVRQEIGENLVSSVHAKLNRESNTIEIKTNENTLKLMLHLNDHLVDLEKPFTVSTNDKNGWTGKKERSLEKLLKSYWTKGDATRLFTNDLLIDVPK